MKKNILGLIVSMLLVLSLCFIVVACNDDEEPNNNPPSTSSSNTASDDVEDGDEEEKLPTGPFDSEDAVKLTVDYKTMTYVGTSLKDFSPIFDEQDFVKDPRADMEDGEFPVFPVSFVPVYDADGNGDVNSADREHIYEVTVDLGAEHYVDSIYVFFEAAGDSITFETGEPFKYDNTVTYTCESMSWASVDIKKQTRYINVKFNNGQAPSELVFYGIRTGKYDPVNTEKHEYKDFDYFLGINGNQADRSSTLKCASYFRDYINWLWCFERSSYPEAPGTTYTTVMSGLYDAIYKNLTSALFEVRPVPCFMFGASDFNLTRLSDYVKPESYVMYGEFMYQTALRFGYNKDYTKENAKHLVKVLGLQLRFNQNTIQWIEAGNEPNGEGNDGFSPYELAAFTSCAYDGHCNTVIAPTGSGVGVINANSNVKMAMAGLAGVGTRYIQAMSFWMKHNRSDGELALDAFNVHTYCKKLITHNGYQVYVGVCPEIGKITEYVIELCEWRDKYYPDKEVWLTEFGWDTNTSYQTENACHPYADFTAREIQAMWIVRAYFMFAAAGVDRCALYMASDFGDEATCVGKYGTSGVISVSGEFKDSYYYIYTLKNTMGDMHFAEIIDSGDENVWIYRFENGEGKSCYALWCPTMDDVRVDGYKLNIDGTNATLTEFKNLETSGVSSDLTVEDGCVTVNVSERPILVFSE